MNADFEASLEARGAADHADFLLPHLRGDFLVLDVGCGEGTISLGLAGVAGRIVGVDREDEEFAGARSYAAAHGIRNVEFCVGNVYDLDFPDDHFDACLCHSMLEMLDEPHEGLVEIRRVLKPGGVLGVACVEYDGLILAGPGDELLRRFYTIRERVWQLENAADPYRGRHLRSLLERAGFSGVSATAKYVSSGTADAVESFGRDRAADCGDTWYARSARAHGLATAADLEAMRQAWLVWSKSPDAYLAFAWCRALGWKPG